MKWGERNGGFLLFALGSLLPSAVLITFAAQGRRRLPDMGTAPATGSRLTCFKLLRLNPAVQLHVRVRAVPAVVVESAIFLVLWPAASPGDRLADVARRRDRDDPVGVAMEGPARDFLECIG